MARILVVEDKVSLAFVLKKALELGGHNVVIAHTHEEAQEALEESNFDLVHLDRDFPSSLSGAAPGPVLAKQLQDRGVPVLGLSAATPIQFDDVPYGDVYLVKPVDLNTYLTAVAELLRIPETEG